MTSAGGPGAQWEPAGARPEGAREPAAGAGGQEGPEEGGGGGGGEIPEPEPGRGRAERSAAAAAAAASAVPGEAGAPGGSANPLASAPAGRPRPWQPPDQRPGTGAFPAG